MDNLDPLGNVINHPSARGTVLDNGKFRCGLTKCNAVMTNARHHISSHISKKHKVNSAFQRAEETNRRSCGICGFTAVKFHTLVTHVRIEHGFRGSSKVLEDQYPDTEIDGAILIPSDQCLK
ncbi:hypothetical protein F4811DRAFT_356344 [Daldinia bambusicola]|nr:hypothetical protein F4811DRAFT_356344 [Daldinia bambusicola]